MRRIQACYSETYLAESRMATLSKLGAIATAVERHGLAERVEPPPIELERLRRLHDTAYVDAFLKGEGRLARSSNLPWSPRLRDAVLATLGGQALGARLALAEGVAANIASGFHHALPDRGGGFCTFNGLALVAQENPTRRVAVLDCDEHGGNGTEAFTERLPNLYNFSIHGSSFGCHGAERSRARRLPPLRGDFTAYREALEEAFDQLLRWRTDLLLYQAGMDCHQGDPLGSLGVTTEDLQERDRLVFEFARDHDIPVLFVMAGAYQPLPDVVGLYTRTFQVATTTFSAPPSPRHESVSTVEVPRLVTGSLV